jgi:PAS domain S-box-containing protein
MPTRPRVLFVEDDALDQMAFKRCVSEGLLECDYVAVDTVAEARRALEHGRFDVIIVDYALKDGSGLDAVGEWMTRIPTIFATGSGCEEVAVKAMKAGAFDYLIKDVERNYLKLLPVTLAAAMEHQRTQRALKESEGRYQDLFENCSDLIQSVSPEGRLLYVNRAWRETLGYDGAELAEMNVFNIVHPDCRDHCGAVFQKLMAGADVGVVDVIFVTKSGQRVELEGNLNIQTENGKPVASRGIFRNVTARKQVEKQLQQLNADLEERVRERTAELRQAMTTLDATEDAAFIFDPATLRFSYVNQGAVRQVGYSREELLRMTPLDLKPEFDGPRFRQLLAPLLSGERQTVAVVTLHRHKDGRTVPVEMNLQHIAPPGEAPRLIAIVRDITERRKTEQQQLRTQRLESIGTLASGVAHDLNNALSPVLMGVELLRAEHPGSAEMLDTMRMSAQRGADMVRQLLTFARGAEGESVAIDPRHLLGEMQKIIKATFPKTIQVRCHPPRSLPVIMGDPTQLHQVLLNLCVNARDAMPNGGELTLEAESQKVDESFAASVLGASPGDYLVLRVRDTGTGIPPEILERIFDPFFTTKAPDKGTGLGLSTTLGIVKGHKGFLQVQSVPERGSTFSIYLPAEPSHTATEKVSAARTGFDGGGRWILLVDDEAVVRNISRTVLQKLNFKVLTATDGADAIIQTTEHRADLAAIITDVNMPYMDGLAFARAARRILPRIPIVVATGRLEDRVRAEFAALGVGHVIEKPFAGEKLSEILRTAFEGDPTVSVQQGSGSARVSSAAAGVAPPASPPHFPNTER